MKNPAVFIALLCSVLFVSCKPVKIINLSGGSSFILGSPSWNDPVGAQVGIESKFVELSKDFSLIGGVNGSLQGAKYSDPGVSGVVRLFYIKAPCVVRGQTKSGFFAELGVEPGILISAKDKYNGESHDYKDYTNSFDLGIPVGAGYEFKHGIGAGFRVIPGLTNISKGSSTTDRNLLILLRATYTIGKD